MLTNATFIKGLVIHATDGELGKVNQFYFDDKSWTIRYLTVKTGDWLAGKRVLVSPMSVTKADWNANRLDVSLTMKQVEHSPSIDTHEPVSRQHEAHYLSYYSYPYYWSGPYLWGSAPYPMGMSSSGSFSAEADAAKKNQESMDSHLRSSEAVTGYRVEATDGEIGHIDGFVIDDEAWTIRYLSVATRNWLPGKKVLISPAWAEEISWIDSEVKVGLSTQAIRTAPEYLESSPLTRDYEERIFSHYGRPRYWWKESYLAQSAV